MKEMLINPLTLRVKPLMIQRFVTVLIPWSLWAEPLSVTIHWKAAEQYFTQFVNLETLSILDLALSGMKGLNIGLKCFQ